MLLAIDVGNTNIVLGLYAGKELRASWRLQTDDKRTVDEYAIEVLALLQSSSASASSVKRMIISCVVPPLLRVFSKLAQKYFSVEPLVVGPGIKTGMLIHVDDPRSVGADRIVNAVAARELFGAPVIVVDFGTATTFDIVSAAGAYEGGIIAPGLLISAEALFERAAMLPTIQLRNPKRLIGKNTQDSMLSGIMFGYASMVDGLIERVTDELKAKPKIVATGGFARLVSEQSRFIDEVVSDLTLQGLRILADAQDE